MNTLPQFTPAQLIAVQPDEAECLNCVAQRQVSKLGDPRGLYDRMPSPYRDSSQTAIIPDPKLQMRDVRVSEIEDLKHLVNGLMQQIVYLQARINSL